MDDTLAEELVQVGRQPADSQHHEAFERAFDLTRSQALAIPVLFEKLFELFATGRSEV